MLKNLLFILLCSTIITLPAPFTMNPPKKTDGTYHITINYQLEPNDALIKNSLRFAFNHPDLTIDWKNLQPAITVYDAHHINDTLGYTGSGKLDLIVSSKTGQFPNEATLFIQYQLKKSEHPQQFMETILFTPPSEPAKNMTSNITQQQDKKEQKMVSEERKNISHTFFDWLARNIISLKNSISDLVEKTSSMPLQLLFVFLLGILMSLTPCIYPMIPITIGILQTTAGSSFLRNFLLACSYTFGIATTFALLGLLAASGSAQFGALLGNPYFVIFLVLFLGYLAFSMLGFYDMYVPRFMRGGDQEAVNGSFIAAFLFGAMSGTAASPCVSPGLFLLLSIVATFGNIFLGFLYLFIFGLGLGTPLLLIGTFSNALNIVPRAGLWMVEVKKLFGFLLLSMCFYYLSNILPWYIILWMIASTLFIAGIWYVVTVADYYSRGMRWYRYIFGTLLLLGSFLLFYQALKATLTIAEPPARCIATTYDEGRAKAIIENKLMLVDFGAQWCTACKEIEHRFFANQWVLDQLKDLIIVQVDFTNPEAETCKIIQKQYKIIGFPTVLLVEPQEQNVIARWGGELLDLSKEDFVELVKKHYSSSSS